MRKEMERECLFVSVLFLVLSHGFAGDVLSCFQCSSKDKGCDTLTVVNKTSQYYLQCPDASHFCRKISQTIVSAEKTIITRKCGWLTKTPKTRRCIRYDTQHELQTTCECYEDGCNLAYSIVQKSPLLQILVTSGITMILNRWAYYC